MKTYTLTLTPIVPLSTEPVQGLTPSWEPYEPTGDKEANVGDILTVVFKPGNLRYRTVELIINKHDASIASPSILFNGGAHNGRINNANDVSWSHELTTSTDKRKCTFSVLVLFTAYTDVEPISPTITTVYRHDPEIIVGKSSG